MAITLAQATELAHRQLLGFSNGEVALRLLPDSTQEFDVGWVFYYQSAAFLESGDFMDQLAGNNPLFIARFDGRHFVIGLHRPLGESLAAYRACGDPSAQQTSEVRLTGWHRGGSTVSAIQAVRRHSRLGLASAKERVESCLAGQFPVVDAASVAEARALVAGLSSIGFHAEIRYAKPGSDDANSPA